MLNHNTNMCKITRGGALPKIFCNLSTKFEIIMLGIIR
jgi:hypothetical protein